MLRRLRSSRCGTPLRRAGLCATARCGTGMATRCRVRASCRCFLPCGSCFLAGARPPAPAARGGAGGRPAWARAPGPRRAGPRGRARGGGVGGVDAGLDPDRMLLVAEPGRRWPQVVASLLDGCELVLLRPPDRPSAQVRRRLEATVRRFGGVLVVAGEWDGAQIRLLVARQEWTGIGAGHGRLPARRAQVVADGRGAAARSRARWLWLPAPDGSVTLADEASVPRSGPFWNELTSTG